MVCNVYLILSAAQFGRKHYKTNARDYCLQCFDAVGWVAGRASGP